MKTKIFVIGTLTAILLLPASAYFLKRQDELLLKQWLPSFSCSDDDIGLFLTDLYERYMDLDKDGIHEGKGPKPGSCNMFAKVWESMSLGFVDSSQYVTGIEFIKDFLLDIIVDNYGYTWTQNEKRSLEPYMSDPGKHFAQGWVFPQYDKSQGKSVGWEFNTDEEGWQLSGGKIYRPTKPNGFLSLDLENSSTLTSPNISCDSFHAAFLEIDVESPGTSGIRIYWQTETEDTFSYERSVGADYATVSPTKDDSSRMRLYFPMYLHPQWKGNITRLKITFQEDAKWAQINFIRLNYDNRQSTTNSYLILTSWRTFLWTGDKEFLQSMLPKMRKAIMFLNNHLQGEKLGYINLEYYQGHDGLGKIIGHDIQSHYWDILPFGTEDFYATIYYKQALEAMAQAEEYAEKTFPDSPKPTVKGPDGQNITYDKSATDLLALAHQCKTVSEKHFWNNATGRFNAAIDVNGAIHDYGYTFLNLEALSAGIGTPAQADSIFTWIDGERIVENDTSTGEDIYVYRFAPRTSTVRNEDWYIWWWRGPEIWPFGLQVQDGGAIFYISYYDLMARIKTGRTTSAYQRLQEIEDWYTDVKNAGGAGSNFFKKYYENTGITLQGTQPGALGLDIPFVYENSMIPTILLYGFQGIDTKNPDTLIIQPNLPPQLEWAKTTNIHYKDSTAEIKTQNNTIEIKLYTPPPPETKIKIVLPDPGTNLKALLDGEIVQIERIEGKIIYETTYANHVFQVIIQE